MSEKRFPILNAKGVAKSVPWSVLEPHREQAMKNHYQTLERLAERGGLSAEEMLAVVLDMRFDDVFSDRPRRSPT